MEGEEVSPLEINSAIYTPVKPEISEAEKNFGDVIIQTDTLFLPFIDDFSVDRTKRRIPGVDTLEKVLFRVDGAYADSISVVDFPTFMYFFNISTQLYDSFETRKTLVFYENDNPASPQFSLPTDTDTVWSSVTYRFNEFSVDTLLFTPATTHYNTRDTFLIVADDPFFLWTDSFAYINKSFGVNPPTIGVATFDGLNASGVAYDLSSPFNYGSADRLSSKPVDLSGLTPDSSVVLSFYYQPQGLGDFPDPEDSLVLEFYSPSDSLWYRVWSTAGITTAQSYQQPVFQPVKIPVTDSKYLSKGFQFRFRNYATLSGMYDLWNIDYVYLDKHRSINSNALNDFGFVNSGTSFVNTYTSMPMKAFKGNAAQYMVPDFLVKMTNMDSVSDSRDSIRFLVTDEFETIEYFESGNIQKSFSPQSQASFYYSVFSSPSNFQFTPSDSDRTVFQIKLFSEQPAADLCPLNDTVIHKQVFDSYFAYDDGSAEQLYTLVPQVPGPGPKLAYKFNTSLQDSLRGIFLYFPYLHSDISQRSFKITVWNDNGGIPGSIVYEDADLDFPKYSDSIGQFVRYKIEPPIQITGTYYIGWQQTPAQDQEEKIRLGFDKNINNQNKIFFNTSGTWYNTSQTGSLMIRPDFGEADPVASVGKENISGPAFNFFPNPAGDRICFFRVSADRPADNPFVLEIYNTLGERVLVLPLSGPSISVDISSFPVGIYFLKTVDVSKGFSHVQKLLIAR